MNVQVSDTTDDAMKAAAGSKIIMTSKQEYHNIKNNYK